jgi:beta-glucosidase
MNSNAMKILTDRFEPYEVINRPEEDKGNDAPVVLYELDEELEISLDGVCTDKNSVYCYELVITNPGCYEIEIAASSEQSEVAQIPVTYFNNGTVCASVTWSGTNGKTVSVTKKVYMFSRFNTIRFFFAQSGLDMKSIRYRFLEPLKV